MTDFYITLPSSVSNSQFKNTSSRYLTRLPQVLNLERDKYVVAATDVIYPFSYVNVGKPLEYWIHFKSHDKTPIHITFPSAQYSDADQITNTLNGQAIQGRLKRAAALSILENEVSRIKRARVEESAESFAEDFDSLGDNTNTADTNTEASGDKDKGSDEANDKDKTAASIANDFDALGKDVTNVDKNFEQTGGEASEWNEQIEQIEEGKFKEVSKMDDQYELLASFEQPSLVNTEFENLGKAAAQTLMSDAAEYQLLDKITENDDSFHKESGRFEPKDSETVVVFHAPAVSQSSKSGAPKTRKDSKNSGGSDSTRGKVSETSVENKTAEPHTTQVPKTKASDSDDTTENAESLASQFDKLGENTVTSEAPTNQPSSVSEADKDDETTETTETAESLDAQFNSIADGNNAPGTAGISKNGKTKPPVGGQDNKKAELRDPATGEFFADEYDQLGDTETFVDEHAELEKLEKEEKDKAARKLDLEYQLLVEGEMEHENAVGSYIKFKQSLMTTSMDTSLYQQNLENFKRARSQIIAKKSSSSKNYLKFSNVGDQIRVDFLDTDIAFVEFDEPCAYFFGFVDVIVRKSEKAPKKIDFFGNVSTLYLYCDVVDPIIVGNIKSSLLTVIPCKGTYGQMIHHTVAHPRYLPLVKSSIDSIRVELLTEFSEPIDFHWGSTIIVLHFKKSE